VKPIAFLLAAAALAGCANPAPYVTTVGLLKPGKTLTVHVAQATFNAYQPASKDPRDRFTVAATASKKSDEPNPPSIRPGAGGISIDAPFPLASLLVRVPDGVRLVVRSDGGDVHVTDITGNADVTAKRGDVQIMLPGYAQVRDQHGNISVTMGSIDWPGTLRFASGQGDVEVWISEKAAFTVHMHTDNGTLFSDFNLRGTSQGQTETIDGRVNGGGSHGLDIETANGTIRLLKLHPEV
jgi:hypothetical protein